MIPREVESTKSITKKLIGRVFAYYLLLTLVFTLIQIFVHCMYGQQYDLPLVILGATVKSAAIWLVFLFFTQKLLGRPLADLTRAIEKIDLDTLDQADIEIETSAGGEIRFLEESFNDMIGKLREARMKLVDKKKTEEILRISEENYRNIFDSVNDAIFVMDIETGTLLEVNRRMREMFGYEEADEAEILRLDIDDLSLGIPPYTSRDAMRSIAKAARGEPQLIEWRAKHRSGRIFWVEVSLLKIVIRGNVRMLAVIRDIENKKMMEDDLLNTKKMEAIGVLAGGIAHDYNNLLAVIMGNVELVKSKIEPSDPCRNYLQKTMSAAKLAEELTKKLIAFSSGGSSVKRTFQVDDLVKSSVSLALSGSSVHCEFSFPDDLWSINVDFSQMTQAIANIVHNSREAMQDGGLLKVSAENTELHSGWKATGLELKRKRFVKITIRDQGSGVSAEHLPSIFEPYFSTKERGADRGIGLGLPIAYSIIRKHNGQIDVESLPGKGTVVIVYLPAVEEKFEEKKAPDRKMPEQDVLPFGPGKWRPLNILVMDDEEMVRETIREILEQIGHRSVPAGHGAEAIELYFDAMKSGQFFDAVFLDLTIKDGMGGIETITRLKDMNPGVIAFVCSGYSDDPVMKKFEEFGFSGAFTKPFSKEEIEKVLERVFICPT